MTDIPLQPAALAQYDTTSHHDEKFDGPDAEPYRFDWRAVHGAQLAADFKLALKKLEGLLYVIWGGQPIYAESKQWYEREHPRCRWSPEQWWRHPVEIGQESFWEYLETAALGDRYSGEVPSVPVRSRSGDPAFQLKRAGHSQYFPLGSVQRYCATPGSTGHQVHDPAGTFKQFAAWPDAEDVVIRYEKPAGLAEDVDYLKVMTNVGLFDMAEVEPGVWEATIPAQTQDTWIDWFIFGVFTGSPDAHFDPFVGFDGPYEIPPTLRGRITDPEHGRTPADAYSFVFFSHYNPYAHGLPELLDENEPHSPGNWLRRGTDEYRFDSSEDIQPELVNLARFVLDYVGRRFQHSPEHRGERENCCIDMPIDWRWSGSHTPDLYREGGKGGASGTQPLHNHPAEPNAGSENARKSWRGIEMAWRDADTVPGFFPDNWWYGDNESWLTWAEQLTLDPDPQNPPFQGIMRHYGGRGLAAGDAIDPVHLQEIIDAVDYLCQYGLWTTTEIRTAKYTPGTAWGQTCGRFLKTCSDDCFYPGYCDDHGFNYEIVSCSQQCCHSCVGPDQDVCVPWARPSYEECWSGQNQGAWKQGRCWWARDGSIDWMSGVSGSCIVQDWTRCNASSPDPLWFGGGSIAGGKNCFDPDGDAGTGYVLSGWSYYLCGPSRTVNGPEGDAFHGNSLRKARFDHDDNFSETGPSMGNRFGSVHACEELAPGETIEVGFGQVAAVKFEGVATSWWWNQALTPVCAPFEPPPPIPGLGLYNYEGTEFLYELSTVDFGTWIQYGISGNAALSAWPTCRGDKVFVSIDLHQDENGVPQLYDYDLGIADPFDTCPCETWTGMRPCLQGKWV